jgi:Uncharacterized conserved protein, contains double-stranded beta-helix domain
VKTKSKGQKSKTSGIVPHIFEHYKASPIFYNFENMSIETVNDKISRQYIYSGQSMLVKWIFKKGAEVPLHHHVNEQITWITKGSVKVFSQGKEFIIKSGEIIIFPPHVPHEFFALEDTIDIDFFTPVREDWINESASYLKKKSK